MKAALFQSTRPARGATPRMDRKAPIKNISIHAPREGRDPGTFRIRDDGRISIHVPREGRDAKILLMEEK